MYIVNEGLWIFVTQKYWFIDQIGEIDTNID